MLRKILIASPNLELPKLATHDPLSKSTRPLGRCIRLHPPASSFYIHLDLSRFRRFRWILSERAILESSNKLPQRVTLMAFERAYHGRPTSFSMFSLNAARDFSGIACPHGIVDWRDSLHRYDLQRTAGAVAATATRNSVTER